MSFRSRVGALAAITMVWGLTEAPSRAEVESDLVKKGLAAYRGLDFGSAIDLLTRALTETLTTEEKVVTYKTLGFAHVALGQINEAKNDFRNLLRVDGSFELDRSVSPRFRTVFQSVKASMISEAKAKPVPRVAITPKVDPAYPQAERPIIVRATHPEAQRVQLFHRISGSTVFSRIDAGPRARGDFEVVVPGILVRAPAIEYYLVLLDEKGAAVGTAGAPAEPLVVAVKPRKKPVYAKGWFWVTLVGVTAAAAGAVAAAVTLSSNDSKVTIVPR